MIETRVLSGIHRILPQTCPSTQIRSFTAFANEPLSFQVAFRADTGVIPFYIRIDSALPLTMYAEKCVAVPHMANTVVSDAPKAGMIPDILLKKQVNPPIERQTFLDQVLFYEKGETTHLHAYDDSWQAVWLTVNEQETPLEAGEYVLHLQFCARDGAACVGEATVTVRILADMLPPQQLYYTNWFHCDCLADHYGVDIFSDRFFEIFERHVRVAAQNGMNMLLTPAFTPPLDIPDGGERQTAQLVGVCLENGVYTFDFALMKRYLDVAKRAGISYFEHAHLFTQGGAAAAPKIMATVDGEYRRIFGFDTKADGAAYTAFLHAYLPALRAFLEKEKLFDRFLFHISDEPRAEHEAAYTAARKVVGDALHGGMLGDALWDYAFYEKGLVDNPIVSVDTVHNFVGKCDDLWCYYTGGHVQECMSNRVYTVSHERNRMLGTQLYFIGAKGFLHWGYNYWYDWLSNGLFDPNIDPCGLNGGGGSSFIVYPAPNGDCRPSIRQKVFYMGLADMRALQLLEMRRGRAACEKVIEAFFGKLTMFVGPKTPEQLLAFREAVNEWIVKEK